MSQGDYEVKSINTQCREDLKKAPVNNNKRKYLKKIKKREIKRNQSSIPPRKDD